MSEGQGSMLLPRRWSISCPSETLLPNRLVVRPLWVCALLPRHASGLSLGRGSTPTSASSSLWTLSSEDLPVEFPEDYPLMAPKELPHHRTRSRSITEIISFTFGSRHVGVEIEWSETAGRPTVTTPDWVNALCLEPSEGCLHKLSCESLNFSPVDPSQLERLSPIGCESDCTSPFLLSWIFMNSPCVISTPSATHFHLRSASLKPCICVWTINVFTSG